MKTSDIRVGDCWNDASGHHWFCKYVDIPVDETAGKVAVYMVKYQNDGFKLLTLDQFVNEYYEAVLYMREGKHPR